MTKSTSELTLEDTLRLTHHLKGIRDRYARILENLRHAKAHARSLVEIIAKAEGSKGWDISGGALDEMEERVLILKTGVDQGLERIGHAQPNDTLKDTPKDDLEDQLGGQP